MLAISAPHSERGLSFVYGVGVLLLFAHLLARWSVHRSWPMRVLTDAAPRAFFARAPEGALRLLESNRWWIAGALVVALGLTVVELADPPFFLQDDNFDQFLPVITWGYRSLRAGVLPLWNPHQLLGAPTLNLGIYALSYPPSYLCAALASAVGHPAWTLDAFALLHLALAYPASYWAARRGGIGAPLASAAALCFVLCGYHLVIGRSWFYVLPSAVCMPLLLGLLARFGEGPVGVRWTLSVGALLGLLFHAGNAQLWIYCLLLFDVGVLVLVATGSVPFRRLSWAVVAQLIAVALAAPLLYPQLAFVHGLKRVTFASGDIGHGLLAMVLPFGAASAAHPMVSEWGQSSVQRDQFALYSAGGLLPALALCGVLLTCVSRWPARAALHTWLVAAGLTFLMAMGKYGGLWPMLARLPMFSAFQGPFKLLGLFNLFACLAGAAMIERGLAKLRHPRTATLAVWTFCAAATLYNLATPLPSNYSWPTRAYEVSPLVLERHQRVLPLAPRRTDEPHAAEWLTQNLPSMHDYASVQGYDTFIEATPENRAAARALRENTQAALDAYGIDRVLLRTGVPPWTVSPWHGDWQAVAAHLPALPTLQQRGALSVLAVPSAQPLAFTEDMKARELSFTADGEGVRVALPPASAARTLVLNYLWRKDFTARASDGRALPLRADRWGRMLVDVPTDTLSVAVGYRPPFGTGLAAMLVLLCCAAVGLRFLQTTNLGKA